MVRIVAIAVVALLSLAAGSPAQEPYPTRPISIINPREQFVGIARLNADPPILAVNGPWKTLKELVDDAKKRPGEFKAFWDKDAQRIASVIQFIGKTEGK